jgi:hypothetical protein
MSWSIHGSWPTVIGLSLKVIDGKDWARTVDTTVLSGGKLEFSVGKLLALEAHLVYQNMS